MSARLLNRYILREVFLAWGAVILVLLAIMVATRFANFLSMAARGDLPRDLLMEVVALSSLRYLVILMPASLLLGIMLSLGRLYSDNEIAAMMGCGVSLGGLYRPFVLISLILAALTAWLAFQIGPWAGREGDFLVKDSKRLVQYTPFEPARFKTVANGRAVFYTEDVDIKAGTLGEVFARIEGKGVPSYVSAPTGSQAIDPSNGDRLVTLRDGYRYEGQPGRADFEVTHFNELTLRISPPAFTYVNNQRKMAPTSDLLNSQDPEDRAEIQGRLGAPLSLLILALIAIPLSHLAPRQSRYSKVVYGLLAFLIYANLLGVGQAWVGKSELGGRLGLWPVHGLMIVMTVVLMMRRRGLRS